MAESLFTQKEINFLKILINHKVEFLVIGLSAAALQGAPVVTQDIDLWFKELNSTNFKAALKEAGVFYVPPINLNPPMFAGESTELIDIVVSVTGLDSFEAEYENAIEITLPSCIIRVLPLDRIIKSKKKLNRSKDKLVVPVLEDVLSTINALQDKNKK